jgi:cbb3-type cytochrome oxidase subunit 1
MKMSLSGVLLGLISIAITIAILLLVGAVILWVCNILTIGVPEQVRKIYIAIVALIALYLLVALLFGLPMPIRILHGDTGSVPQLAATPSIMAPER